MVTDLVSDLPGPPIPRTCGRCRGEFPGDGDAPQGLDTGWWACPTCRDRLFGSGGEPAPWRAERLGPIGGPR
jgi:hypothetical protein